MRRSSPTSDLSLCSASSNLLCFRIHHLPIKRVFDILLSVSALFLLLPFLLAIALAIRCTSQGKSIYSQERIGRGGQSFKCYKFRTMYKNADVLLKELLNQDEKKRIEWNRSYKLKDDPRITRIGAFLRKTSLDELPQFWNVLKGDLSVVGPRPVVKEELQTYFKDKAAKIFSIRPGITGLWQVSGRSDTSYAERIALDEYYVQNRSLFFDLKIVALTIPKMFSKKGAY